MNAPPDTPPTRIGDRYRLEERIGAGAMGAVWRGTDELLNRPVALKELLAAAARPGGPGVDGVEESRQRLMREGRIGARLQHPHVISMFDVVIHDDRPWLVMEYLPSLSLAQVLGQKGPMDPRAAADVGRQVADGLAAAHLAGVVHRDVKPGNVLLAEDGRVKLTDFGVSRAVDDVQLTRTGLIAGTPAYLAPEIARGREPTAASDVFALGATLYAAVEGTPPFGLDDNAYALLHKVATGEVDPPRQAGALRPVLMTLLAPEPGDRPTAAQARDALAGIAGGHDTDRPTVADAPQGGLGGARPVRPPLPAPPRPVVAPPRPVAARPRPVAAPTGRRRLVPLLVAALLLVLLVGGGVLAAVLAGNPIGGTPPTAEPSASAQPPAEATQTETPEPDPTTTSPTPSATPPATTDPPSATAGVPPTEPVAFVLYYYSLLPGDTDAAFALLSPQAQEAAGGRASYDAFYADFASVAVLDPVAVSDTTVEATVVFTFLDGSTQEDPYRFVMTERDGQTIMESFEVR